MLGKTINKIATAKHIGRERRVTKLAIITARALSPRISQKVSSYFRSLIAEVEFQWWRLSSRRKIVFCTFADGHNFTTERLEAEAASLGVFDRIVGYGPADLNEEFLRRFREHLKHSRGFGFWAWKPQVILQELDSARPGDILIYADAGCSVMKSSALELKQLLPRVIESGCNILVTENPTPFLTRHWTKADLLDRFGWCSNEEILDSRLVEAGRLAIVVTAETKSLMRQWLEIASELPLIDDSPSCITNDPEFREHRHDQSIFSLLLRRRRFCTGLERVFDTTRLRARVNTS